MVFLRLKGAQQRGAAVRQSTCAQEGFSASSATRRTWLQPGPTFSLPCSQRPQGGALPERPQDLHTLSQLTTSQEPGALFIVMVLNPEEVGGAIPPTPQATFTMPGNGLGCLSWGGWRTGMLLNILQSIRPMTELYVAQNVNISVAKKPWSALRVLLKC